ncbi:hypothetical protein MBLNU459_g6548t1 [Dothideomycetes sp. NU459]
MVKFRRSLKSEKHESSAKTHHIQHISIPPKDSASILPPKKVIKAVYDYEAPTDPPIYLSFSAGDFLHVVGRENDSEWFEACNPVQGSRGLVPVKYFEAVGKTVQDSDSRGSTGSTPSTHHDSGYAASGQLLPEQHRMSKSMGRVGGAPVYGVVAYDFKAERPDELDAKEGEAIIVIAQSNAEWFVAKPITRLGGPGLIPVSFIEIKDMSTGKTVSDSQAAVARAGIPKVEEWKKMAAEYKNTSIPLGSFGTQNSIPAGSMASVEQGMGRMSMNGRPASQSQANGYSSRHSRTPSNFAQPQPQHSLAPLRASVPRYLYADDKFHFVVEVALTDNTHWDLTRIYEDFYELQINLIKAFPEEAGNTGLPRTLPLMPGPVQFVTDRITEGRRENLDEYLYKLLRLGSHIATSDLVRGFFQPKGNDYECDASQIDFNEHSRSQYAPGGERYRDSAISHGSAPGYAPSPSDSRQSSQTPHAAGHQRGQSSVSGSLRGQGGQGHYRTPSEYTNSPATTHSSSMPPPMLRQVTATSAITTASSTSAGAALKVKVWFDRETCVVLRLPPRGSFNFTDLYHKIVERRRLEYNKHVEGDDEEDALEVEYRDEKTGEYYRLNDDESLDIAVGRNEKLTLVVRTAGSGDRR